MACLRHLWSSVLYSGNPLYPQKAKSFILTYFLFQGILELPSRSWLALYFFSLISRYSSIFKAFSMVSCKRKRPHRTVFPLYKVFGFSLFYSFPRLKIFAPWVLLISWAVTELTYSAVTDLPGFLSMRKLRRWFPTCGLSHIYMLW